MSGLSVTTNEVLAEVLVERAQQDAKWGEQNHPDGTGFRYLQRKAAQARRDCDTATRAGTLTWRHILREEYHEALAESDPEKLRAELIQLAAVAAAWVEAIDRREGGGGRAAEQSGPHSVSPAPPGDAGSRERLDRPAATGLPPDYLDALAREPRGHA